MTDAKPWLVASCSSCPFHFSGDDRFGPGDCEAADGRSLPWERTPPDWCPLRARIVLVQLKEGV